MVEWVPVVRLIVAPGFIYTVSFIVIPEKTGIQMGRTTRTNIPIFVIPAPLVIPAKAGTKM